MEASVVSRIVSIDFADWIALQEGRQGDLAGDVVDQIATELQAVARRFVEEVTGKRLPAGDSGLLPYVQRIWNCVEIHWRRFAEAGPIQLSEVISRLELGQLGHDSNITCNVLRDVVLAQAMELLEEKAAVMFENDYMPNVRIIAQRTGGAGAVEMFGNLAADLILPREGKPPRIAGYRGKAALVSWLRTAVVRDWISHKRKKAERASETAGELVAQDEKSDGFDVAPCEQLLRPIFVQAVASLNTDDRVILKLLILDNVPQQELARRLGIHSGNLTRRRQKAAAHVLQQVQQLSSSGPQARQAGECLELLLTDGQLELKQRLAEVLTAQIRSTDSGNPALPQPELEGEVP